MSPKQRWKQPHHNRRMKSDPDLRLQMRILCSRPSEATSDYNLKARVKKAAFSRRRSPRSSWTPTRALKRVVSQRNLLPYDDEMMVRKRGEKKWRGNDSNSSLSSLSLFCLVMDLRFIASSSSFFFSVLLVTPSISSPWSSIFLS